MGAYKFGFQKEWYHFGRTFRFGGILIALFSVAIANPLMIKAVVAMLGAIGESPTEMMADAAMPDMGLGDLVMEYTSGVVFGAALSDLCNTALLVILLLLMSPFGGEQKKRATLIPSCSGLDNKYYLIPKFVLYPAIIFVTTFFCRHIGGTYLQCDVPSARRFRIYASRLGALRDISYVHRCDLYGAWPVYQPSGYHDYRYIFRSGADK